MFLLPHALSHHTHRRRRHDDDAHARACGADVQVLRGGKVHQMSFRRGEPGRFPGRIDAARLQRHRGHAGQPHDEDGHQRDDRESRLDRDGPGVCTG